MTLLILGLAFIILTALGLPISFAVGVSSVIATFLLPGVDNATIVQRMLTAINTFPLLAVIFFVFAGMLMARGGIARRLVMMAEVLVGWLPGSLAQIVCVASMFFGGVTGSAVAEVSSIGAMMIPAMEKDGYSPPLRDRHRAHRRDDGPDHSALDRHDRVRACRRQRVDRGAVSRRRHSGRDDRLVADGRVVRSRQALSPEELPKLERREKIRRVIDGMAGVFTMVIILGGIISGVFTATEAGAAAAVYALILTIFVYREINISEFPHYLGMLCHQRGGDAADRHLFGLCLDFHLRNLPRYAGGQFLQPDPEQMGVPAHPQFLPAHRRDVRRHDPGADHAGADAAAAGAQVRHQPGTSRPDHGDQPVFRSDHAAGWNRVFVALKVGRNSLWRRSSPRFCRCSPVCALFCFSSPSAKNVCVAAAQLRAGQVARWPPPHQHDAERSLPTRPISAIGLQVLVDQRPRDQRRRARHDEEAGSGLRRRRSGRS